MIDEEDSISGGDDYVLRTPSGEIHFPELGVMSEDDVVAYWRKMRKPRPHK